MVTTSTIDRYFVCIGAQKAGTTWLVRVLDRHPDIFVTPVKEIHYFDHIAGLTRHLGDRKRRSRYRKYHQKLWTQPTRFARLYGQWPWYRSYMQDPIDDDWYVRLFERRGDAAMAGEATPEYALIGQDGFRHMQRLAPDARLLYVLRNPVAQVWSQVLHHCRSNGVDVRRTSDNDLITLIGTPRIEDLGNYEATLDDVLGVFPGEQVLTLFYEDIHKERLASLEHICAFLDVGFSAGCFPSPAKRYNRSQDAELPDAIRHHLREKYRAMAARLAERVGSLPESWRQEFALG